MVNDAILSNAHYCPMKKNSFLPTSFPHCPARITNSASLKDRPSVLGYIYDIIKINLGLKASVQLDKCIAFNRHS